MKSLDFAKSKPYTERRYDDNQNARHIFCVEHKGMPDPIGTFDWRNSLTNIRFRPLTISHGKLALLTTDKPNRQTAFPIESECPGPSNKSFNEKVADIPPDALRVIEALQPYTQMASV